MKTGSIRLILIPLLILLLSWIVSADGGAWRAPTPQEKIYHDITLNTIAKSLPDGPPGWQLVSQTEIKALDRIAKGAELAPFPEYYSVEWIDQTLKNTGDSKVVEALSAFERGHADDPKVAAINQQRERFAAAIGQAAGRGDAAAMEKLIKEQDVWDAKLSVIYAAWDKERDAIIAANEAHDYSLKISIEVNEFYQAYVKMTPGTPVAGIPVYRAPGGHINGNWSGETNYVFLGKNLQMTFQKDLSILKMPPAKGLPYLAVRLIEVVVQADPPRARQVLADINWQLLQGLIK